MQIIKFIKNGQAATETLIVLAISLIVFLGIFVINQENISNVSTDFEVTQARTALDSLSNSIELVYQQGEGAKTKVYINLPRSLKGITIYNQTIIMTLYGQESDITLHNSFDFSLNGSIEVSQGNQWVTIESAGNNVLIGNYTEPQMNYVCGNSLVEPGENCDTLNLNGQTCISQGYDYGSLACTLLCTFDYSGCGNYVCGNNLVEGTEVCDGTNLSGETCISQGYTSGTLLCLNDCTGYNYSLCVGEDTQPPAWVTNLQNQSQGRTWVYWTWTNPLDTDFNTTILYLNGINILNTSNNFYNATGLIPNQLYNLTVHTMDHSGNINNSDVSSATRTYAQPQWVQIFFDNFNYGTKNNPGPNWTETGGQWSTVSNRAEADNCDAPGDQMTSININLAGTTAAKLAFEWEYHNLDTGECLSLDLNDGTGWIDEVWIVCGDTISSDLGTTILDLTSFISLTSTVQLRFDCLNSAPTEDNFIDNVNVSAYAP